MSPLRNAAASCVLVAITLAVTGCGSGSRQGAISSPSTSASTTGKSAPTVTPAKKPRTWAAIFNAVSSGVVRIDTSYCDSWATGTGFLVGPHLVATVAHVVEGAGGIRVTSPALGIATSARVIGIDHDRDLALLTTDATIDGHVFALRRSPARVGEEMIAVGFALAHQMQLTQGNVQGIHDHRHVDPDYDLSNVVLTDAALNPGNSGGPWIAKDERVIALDESGPPWDDNSEARAQGSNGGIAVTDAIPLFDQWRRKPAAVPTGECQLDTTEAQMTATLQSYFIDLNNSDFESAYAQRDEASHRRQSKAEFIDDVASSSTQSVDEESDYLFDVDGTGVDDSNFADVSFVSSQHADQGPDGESCSVWHLRYHFTLENGLFRIRSAQAQPGKREHQPCAGVE